MCTKMYVSLGSKVRPRTFVSVAMGSIFSHMSLCFNDVLVSIWHGVCQFDNIMKFHMEPYVREHLL